MKMSLSRSLWAATAAAVLVFAPARPASQQVDRREPGQAAAAVPGRVHTHYRELCTLLAVWDPNRTETSVVAEPEWRVVGDWYRQRVAGGVSNATISVNYGTGFTPEARAAFQAAVDIWAATLTSPVPITVDANFSPLGTGVLGQAGSTFVYSNTANATPNTFYHAALANKLAGVDVDPTASDITATFNSAFTSWYFGTDRRTPANRYDFMSVVLHELGHGLGFSGSATSNGTTGSYGLGTGLQPMIYDRFVETAARQPLLNTATFPNPSAALHAALTSQVATDAATGLFWNGARGIAGNGGGTARPQLDALAPFTTGSNYSHLSESTFAAGNANSLMTRALSNGEVIHSPGPITLGMFQDEGWSIPSAAPIGSFDTPAEASTVSGSIAVTGWALDNIAVTKVSILRDAHANDPAAAVVNGRVFVGDAAFVAGARPDIEAAFAVYPNARRAGWGYLMLTRGLIWDGRGPFKLYAVAFDFEGNQTTLGSKTITVNNATATKPFGSIDTPASGATIGGNYPNTGWVLVPGTGVTIPASGVQVYIDTTLVPGTPSTSARADISAGFPGFDTSQAGRGLFIDTTKFTNGTHTIGWLVTASNGQADGIGSRFIQITNGAQTAAARLIDKPVSALPGIDNGAAVRVATTLGAKAPESIVRPDAQGRRRVRIDELGRIAVRAVKGQAAYHVANGQLRALPLGATFDAKSGTFFWQTSAGFVGDYEFVVVDEARPDPRKLTRLVVSVGQSLPRLAPDVSRTRATN